MIVLPPLEDSWVKDLMAKDDRYRRLFNGLPQVEEEVLRARHPCRHLGEETGETRQCPPCGGNVQIKLLACDVYGSCSSLKELSGVPWCLQCKSYVKKVESFDPYPIRDLAYHVYPLAGNGSWQWNVRQLLSRISLFNGKRVVAISHNSRCSSVEQVKAAFRGEIEDQNFIVVPNNPGAPETTTLPLMLERLETRDPNRCLLRAHTKGVSRWEDPRLSSVIRDWSQVLYESMLDYWPIVEEQLTTHSVTGAFRWQTRMWPNHSASTWFYSGSWYWIRSRHLFQFCDWKKIDQFWAGIESYPSLHFDHAQSACVVCDEANNVYDGRHWNQHLRPTYDQWALDHWDKRTDHVRTTSLILATVITEDYLPRARAFLSSLSVVKSAKCFCICNGWHPSSELAKEYPHVTFRHLPKHSSESFGMTQHGRFLDAIPELGLENIVVLSDADVIVQRDFSPNELYQVEDYRIERAIGLGWNGGDRDTMGAEAERIGLKDTFPYDATSPDWRMRQVLNCGVMAAKVRVWRELQEAYELRCDDFYKRTQHRSRCQWLINWCIEELRLAWRRFDGALHSHGHFGIPQGVGFLNGVATWQGDPSWQKNTVMFRHKL